MRANGARRSSTAASATFQAINRNKRSAVCELRDPAQRAAAAGFHRRAGGRGAAESAPRAGRRGRVGAAALLARKPRLIYCNIGAFGPRVRSRGRPGYDPLMQALAAS